MTKLHELVAVEPDREQNYKKVLEEAKSTFSNRQEHFMASSRKLEMFDENRQQENFEEASHMVTTVADKLKYLERPVGKYLDTFASKEATNQVATASLVVDDIDFGELPATVLLGLEGRLKYIRSIYDAIPTLSPGTEWVRDDDRGDHVWKQKEATLRFRTEKVRESKIVAPATEQHPAQVDMWTMDKPVGQYKDMVWSGMMSVHEKSQILERLDTLIRAVKKARQRANRADQVKLEIGRKIFDYLHN